MFSCRLRFLFYDISDFGAFVIKSPDSGNNKQRIVRQSMLAPEMKER